MIHLTPPSYPGLTQIRFMHHGQNILWLGRKHHKQIVIKSRLTHHHFRFEKERHWTQQARSLGIPCPRIIDAWQDEYGCHIMLPYRQPNRRAWSPQHWYQLLKPLYECQDVPPGWGPLRADGYSRWPKREQAWQWYKTKLTGFSSAIQTQCKEFLLHSNTCLTHNDIHKGNTRHKMIIDWENVAVTNPSYEVALASLASNLPPDRWNSAQPQRLGAHEWDIARLLAATESASMPGPRQHQAKRLIDHWLQS